HRGVKIFILLYQEIERAVDLGSKRTANLLKGLHKNVHIIRHPQRLYRKTLTLRHHVTWLWSNHEKIIAIDQNYAFIGGLDLCYGRWDTREHSYLKPSKWNLDDRFVHSRPLANSIPLDDPISHEFWYAFKNIARRNTKIYAEVFNCIPSDSIRKHQQAKLIVASEALFTCNPAEAENRLAQVRGHLVEYPLHFLEDENLSMTVGTKEFFLPASFWT
ncbi:unnamed protein product, partial [Notodromas monacha]